MTPRVLLLVALASLAVGAAGAWLLKPKSPPPPPLLATVENLGQLVTVKVHTSDIVKVVKPRAVDLPGTSYELRYGGTTVLLVVKGDCSISTDMRLAKFESVDHEKQTIKVVLPRPRLFTIQINHSPPAQGGSKIYQITNNGLEAIIPDDSNRKEAIQKAFGDAQRRIGDACMRAEIISQAKTNTESILAELFKSTGWSTTVQWL